MEALKRGALMALGGGIAILVLVILIVGGVFTFNYFTADHERLALVDKINVMCRNGRGVFREPPSNIGVFQKMDHLEGQRAGIEECSEAKLHLMAYDMRIDLGQ